MSKKEYEAQEMYKMIKQKPLGIRNAIKSYLYLLRRAIIATALPTD